ncbi:30S ribosomal protein S18 [Candidatus Roizmanbacteria bacterium RIFCSPHIGHO2_12_FULL_33_9]|uniref:Small ribosomal subunit protein bS18 n=1 Tax=Candidatus Roizmanbacteria bacterium RIFCSPHIGHO2_12_FULL_33_9 TaxID=1802045 RepID=A0A1F7HFP3_9BACT|nr:MAG: 30S ribosomal protein S18 [Candidatus Roizmanbacteria bacterium RIFCSPHIGHO2_12_FULL_33_9]
MKKCYFCKYGAQPDFKDIENLERFLTPRKKIINRENSGVCARHQRQLTKQIKYARYFALLPYVSYKDSS